MRVAARESAEVENDAVRALRLHVPLHVRVAFEQHLGVPALRREKRLGLAHGVLLHVKGENAAVSPASSHQKRRIAAPCLPVASSTDARAHRPTQKIVHNG